MKKIPQKPSKKPQARTTRVVTAQNKNASSLMIEESGSTQALPPSPGVQGTIHELYRIDDSECVLYIATNKSQIEMACVMAQQSALNSIVYSDGFDFYDCTLRYSRPSFVNSIKGVAAVFKRVTRLVTYIGQVNPNIKKEYIHLLAAALKLELPIIEVPHGLIQSGYNLDDDSRIVDLSSYYEGIGPSLPSIASMRLSWYGKNSIGYPRSAIQDFRYDRSLPEYTVITTNTNWFLYTAEDKRNFFSMVFEYAQSNTDRLFIWSPHPAETNEQTYSSNVLPLRPANLLLYGLKNDVYFDGVETSNDLIAHCKNGISTVTTCLLEYEIHKKDVLIFQTYGVAKILEKLEIKTVFTAEMDILPVSGPIKTGMLEFYNSKRFDEYLSWAPKSEKINSVYLEII
nr:hypothetical protein [uncultured Pseudomonas sp.]